MYYRKGTIYMLSATSKDNIPNVHWGQHISDLYNIAFASRYLSYVHTNTILLQNKTLRN